MLRVCSYMYNSVAGLNSRTVAVLQESYAMLGKARAYSSTPGFLEYLCIHVVSIPARRQNEPAVAPCGICCRVLEYPRRARKQSECGRTQSRVAAASLYASALSLRRRPSDASVLVQDAKLCSVAASVVSPCTPGAHHQRRDSPHLRDSAHLQWHSRRSASDMLMHTCMQPSPLHAAPGARTMRCIVRHLQRATCKTEHALCEMQTCDAARSS